MKRYIIDRFEGEFVVLEDYETGKIQNMKKSCFPSEAKDGDIITVSEDNIITIDKEETKRRREKLKKLKDMLKKDK